MAETAASLSHQSHEQRGPVADSSRSQGLPQFLPVICYLVLVVSGLSGLAYEITWQLLLSALLGSESYATTVVISCFLGGLALGYFAFGGVARTLPSSRLMTLSAILEVFIAVWAVVFEPLLSLLNSSTLEVEEGLRAVLFGVCLVVPPTILMGGTLPLLTQAFALQEKGWEKIHSRLYASNTFGGFLGVLCTLFLFLPFLGGSRTLQVACVGNICAALALWYLAQFFQVTTPWIERGKEEIGRLPLIPLLVSFLVGFSSLSLQVIFVRVFSLSIGSTYYLFSLVLGTYIFWLAVGGWCSISRENSSRFSPALIVSVSAFSLLVIGYLLQYAPYANHLVRIQFSHEASELPLYVGSLFFVLSALLAIPLACFGAFEPSLVEMLSRDRRSKSIGNIVGACYGWNTAGAICGAALTSFFLLRYFELADLFQISVAVLFASSAMLFARQDRYTAVGGAVLGMVTVFFIPVFSSAELGVGLFRLQDELPFSYEGKDAFFQKATVGGKELFAKDGKSVTSLVMEFDEGSEKSRTIFINGKADGNTVGDRVNMNVIGLLGSVLSPPEAKRLGVVGFGTGMTVGAASRFEKYSDLVVFELDENAPHYAKFFSEATSDVTADSRFRWRLGDAIRLLQLEPEPFDVFVSQPSNPWMSGIERLYSEEFYRTVREALSPQGVFVTWFTSRALGDKAVSTILFTFRSHFPRMRIFQFGGDYILVGMKGSSPKMSLLDAYNNEERAAYLASLGFPSPAMLLAHEMWIAPTEIRRAKEQSLFQPYLSLLGAEDFFEEKEANLFSHIHKGQKWYLELMGSKRSILAEHLLTLPLREQTALLPKLLERGCGGTKVTLKEPEWRTERTLCRDSVIAAMVFGLFEPPESLAEDIVWTREFLDVPTTKRADSWVEELSRYALFDSIFVRLSPEALRDRLEGCFARNTADARECQEQLVRTLSLTGHPAMAKKVFNETSPELQTTELRDYIVLNEQLLTGY